MHIINNMVKRKEVVNVPALLVLWKITKRMKKDIKSKINCQ